MCHATEEEEKAYAIQQNIYTKSLLDQQMVAVHASRAGGEEAKKRELERYNFFFI